MSNIGSDRTILIGGETYDPIPYGEEEQTQTYEEALADYDRQIEEGGRGQLSADDVRQEKEQFIERWGDDPEAFNNRECHDCGVEMGEVHRLGCDWERCPNCGGQYFICDCATAEKAQLWGGV